MARRAALGLLILASCGADDFAFLIRDDFETAIFFRATGTGYELRRFERARIDQGAVLAAQDGDQVTLLLYPHTIDALGMRTEPVIVDDGRPIPLASARYVFDEPGGTFVKQASPELPPELASLMISSFPFDDCIRAGGCLSAGDELRCEVPCPTRSIQAPTPPEPPRTVVPPSLQTAGACAGDWEPEEDAALGLTLCKPPPSPAGCVDGEYRFLREVACGPLGETCGATSPAIQLRPADGSAPALFPTIGEALQAAMPGDSVLLASGTYIESALVVGPGVELTGACAAGAIIAGHITIGGSGAALRDLTIRTTGSGTGVSVLPSVTGVSLSALVIEGAPEHALLLQPGSEASVRRVLVRGTGNFGIRVNGARAELEQVAVREASHSGVIADATAGVMLRDVEVRATRLLDGQAYGIAVVETATAAIDGALVDGVRAGILVARGATATVTRALIRNGSQPDAIGIHAQGATELRNVSISTFPRAGLFADGGVVRLRDALIEDISGNEAPASGAGILSSSSTLAVQRTRIERTRVAADLTTSRTQIEDLVVRDITLNGADRMATAGAGLFQSGGRLDVTRAIFSATDASALRSDAELHATDVSVSEWGRAPCDGVCGRSRSAIFGSTATTWTIDGLSAKGGWNAAVELTLTGPASATIRNLQIEDVRPQNHTNLASAVHLTQLETHGQDVAIEHVDVTMGFVPMIYLAGGNIRVQHVAARTPTDPGERVELADGHAFLHVKNAVADVELVELHDVELGLIVQDEAYATVTDLRITGTRETSREGVVADDASIDLERAQLDGDFVYALRSHTRDGLETKLDGEHVAVHCAPGRRSVGAYIQHELHLSLFQVTGCETAFFDAYDGAGVTVSNGLVRGCDLGVGREKLAPRGLEAFLRGVLFDDVATSFAEL